MSDKPQSNILLKSSGSRTHQERTRIEHDILGEKPVPEDAYYGIHTVRAKETFGANGRLLKDLPRLVRAYAVVKAAAAKANAYAGVLDPARRDAIIEAATEIREGKLANEFVVNAVQGGAGTSTNMNVNEVIANRGLENLGFEKGAYEHLHPIDHVNRSQSTNDTYPTALRLALIWASEELESSLGFLAESFAQRAETFAGILKLGRTQLQDAVPISLGREFMAFANVFRDERVRLAETWTDLRVINLGGTAAGTGLNAPSRYREAVMVELCSLTGLEFIVAPDLVQASWDTGALVTFSSGLKRLATRLSKVANDLRLLSSGPAGGLGEIALPACQPGSSMMPAKINPVVPELINQVCFQVIGGDLTVTLAAEAGQLQLNAMVPLIAVQLLDSTERLAEAITTLRKRCVTGIRANAERASYYLGQSGAWGAALNPAIGYDASTKIVLEALANGEPLREVALRKGVPAEALDLLFTTGATG
jgi:aspartate ammonia-lyase